MQTWSIEPSENWTAALCGGPCLRSWLCEQLMFEFKSPTEETMLFYKKIGSLQSKISFLFYCGYPAVDKEALPSSSSLEEVSIWCEAHLKQNKSKEKASPVPQHSNYRAPLRSDKCVQILPLLQDGLLSIPHRQGDGWHSAGEVWGWGKGFHLLTCFELTINIQRIRDSGANVTCSLCIYS